MAKKSMIAKAKREPKFSTRQHNRCTRCGRPRAYYRKFGLCRICVRELANKGELPGVTKGFPEKTLRHAGITDVKGRRYGRRRTERRFITDQRRKQT